MSGDATMADTGVMTIANNAINAAKLADDAVDTAAILDSNVTLDKINFFVDEDNMASNSAVKVPSQQSVKA